MRTKQFGLRIRKKCKTEGFQRVFLRIFKGKATLVTTLHFTSDNLLYWERSERAKVIIEFILFWQSVHSYFYQLIPNRFMIFTVPTFLLIFLKKYQSPCIVSSHLKVDTQNTIIEKHHFDNSVSGVAKSDGQLDR